jgi:hypothetical protein
VNFVRLKRRLADILAAPIAYGREATPNPGALESSVFVPIRAVRRQLPNSVGLPEH